MLGLKAMIFFELRLRDVDPFLLREPLAIF
jgi:hypothetical protein